MGNLHVPITNTKQTATTCSVSRENLHTPFAVGFAYRPYPHMPRLQNLRPNTDVLDRIAVLTGLGWTASILGYIATVIGYGTVLATRLAHPQSLLYLGGVLFAATFGLDRLQDRLAEREN